MKIDKLSRVNPVETDNINVKKERKDNFNRQDSNSDNQNSSEFHKMLKKQLDQKRKK